MIALLLVGCGDGVTSARARDTACRAGTAICRVISTTCGGENPIDGP